MLLANETDVNDIVIQVWEFAPKEVKVVLIGLAGAALIAHYNKKNVIKILAREVSVVKTSLYGIYSFFDTKKIDRNRVMLISALEEYARLVPAMSDELDPLLIAMLEKQQGKYDPDVVQLIQTLRVDLNDYPELSSDVMTVDDVEQVITARKEHHAKILSKITQYLESTSVDDSTQIFNIRKEI